MDNRPIGVFDSGLGGLSCVEALKKRLPGESIIYFGDTARTPYGDKDVDTIRHFAGQVADFLIAQDVKMLLIACNTVSALCVEQLRQRYPQLPIVSIIEPTVKYLSGREQSGNIGIIATKATVRSGLYEKLLYQAGISCGVKSKACPLFVPLIENGFREGSVIDTVVRYYLDDFIQDNRIGTLVLGCTHYPFMKKSLEDLYPNVCFINPSEIVVDEVTRILSENDMEADTTQEGRRQFYASDLSEMFMEMIREITGDEHTAAKFKAFRTVQP